MQVAGVVHPKTSPLKFTVTEIIVPGSNPVVHRLQISGIVCTGCVEAIEAGLKERAGIRGVQIDLESGLAEIEVEDGGISGEALAEAVNALAMEGMPAGTFTASVLKK